MKHINAGNVKNVGNCTLSVATEIRTITMFLKY